MHEDIMTIYYNAYGKEECKARYDKMTKMSRQITIKFLQDQYLWNQNQLLSRTECIKYLDFMSNYLLTETHFPIFDQFIESQILSPDERIFQKLCVQYNTSIIEWCLEYQVSKSSIRHSRNEFYKTIRNVYAILS
jgi:hypothetical protein